ncbi:hypothetical protein [Robertkochia sediminum]|uniref:hypothetical protein n=1 Tax=Robertkochia sediminum TaxID=2785326 RepID=UPI001934A0D6|nr:hypothetical protein [Robertkochia sediminum]MBL7472573.1 hypothetical protein [Robertkochia sediminum]
MKKAFRIISFIAALLGATAYIVSKFVEDHWLISSDTNLIIGLTYLFTSMKFYQLDVEDKEEEIEALKARLAKE